MRIKAIAGILLALMLAGGWFGYSAWEEQRVEAELAEIEKTMDAGRFATARRDLLSMTQRHPGNGRAFYLLGRCEQAGGRFAPALDAWSRVPTSSRWSGPAGGAAADELINSGEYRKAEELLLARRANEPAAHDALHRALMRLYRFQGRMREVRGLLTEGLLTSPAPGEDLKEIWLIETSPLPVEALEGALKSANPDDDRVWLGRANLAIRRARLDEAAEWLEKCLKRTPDDPALTETAFDLAVAKADFAAAATAAERLPTGRIDADEWRRLAALSAQQSGQRDEERRVWESVLAQDPTNPNALERLGVLAAESGQTDDARNLNLRKREIDLLRDEYRQVLLDSQFERDANLLETLASRIGRPLDAKAWASLAREGRVRQILLVESDEPQRLADAREQFLSLSRSTGTTQKERNLAGSALVKPQFYEDAAGAGLDFQFDHGATARRELPETMSGGVAILDYDVDGWMDVFAVQGGTLTDDPGHPREPDRLWRNQGDGTFTDVTARSKIATLPRGYGLGVAVGDIDNDGYPDLFLSRLRSYALWRNRGDGTFEDATREFGLAGIRDNPTSAAFADLDSDGDLDLYVCHYMVYDPENPVLCLNDRGEYFYCEPSKAQPAPDRLFRNDGGRFVDVTEEAGIVDRDGRGLGVVASDLDADGLIDLYIANDGTANFLFHNLGGMRFEEVGLAAGVAGNAEGGYQASMGIACGDIDGDGRPELLVTNFYGEASTLYRNLGSGLFADSTAPSGVGSATRYLLGFGTLFFDYDLDGDLDLATINGHVNDNRPFYPYDMPPQLLANVGGGRFVDVGRDAGGVWQEPTVGRGLAAGDLDNDGREDLVLLPQGEPLRLLRNETVGGNWIGFRLEGNEASRDAVGAIVRLTVDGRELVRERIGGGSYQSAGDPRLRFGLGQAKAADAVQVRWPSGQVQDLGRLEAGRDYWVVENVADFVPRPLHPRGEP